MKPNITENFYLSSESKVRSIQTSLACVLIVVLQNLREYIFYHQYYSQQVVRNCPHFLQELNHLTPEDRKRYKSTPSAFSLQYITRVFNAPLYQSISSND